MKSNVIKIACALAVIIIAFTCLGNTYKMDAEVVEDRGSMVIVETPNGHRWEVYVDRNSFQEGDDVIIEFKESGNPNRQGDDKIVDIRKK